MPSFWAASCGKLVAGKLLWHAADVRQKVVHRLYLLLGAGTRKHLPRAFNQVVGLAARAANSRRVCLNAALANVPVRIEAAFEGNDLDGKALFGQQRDRLLGGVGSGGVRIEVDHDVGGVAAEHGSPAAR